MKQWISIAVCLLLGAFTLSGCSNSSDPFVEKSYTPDAQIRQIHLDVRDREIEVMPSEDGQVHLLYSENSKEYYDISLSDENGLTMTSASKKEWTDYIGGKAAAEDRKIVIKLPDAPLEHLALSTTNEDISLSALTVTDGVNLSSNGGNITFDRLNVGKTMALTVKNGDISGTIIGSYDDFAIHSEVKKGKSNMPENSNDGKKELHVSGNQGDVHIEFIK